MDGWWYWQVTPKVKQWRQLNKKKSAAATKKETKTARANAKLLGKQYVEDPDAYPWDRGDYDGPVNVKEGDRTRRSGMDRWWYWQVNAKKWRPLNKKKSEAATKEETTRASAKLTKAETSKNTITAKRKGSPNNDTTTNEKKKLKKHVKAKA